MPKRRSHRRVKGPDNNVFYVFLTLGVIFVLPGLLNDAQQIILPEVSLPKIIVGGGGSGGGSSSPQSQQTITVPITWEVKWGASSVKTSLNPLSILTGGEPLTSIRATATLDYEAQGTIIGYKILDEMQLLFDGVVKKGISFALPTNPTSPITIGILEATASEIEVWDNGAYATHILVFNIPAGGTFTAIFASGATTTVNIEASSSSVTVSVSAPPVQGAKLIYKTDFENIVKLYADTSSIPLPHRWNTGSGSGSFWMEGLDRSTTGITSHSGSRSVGMEVTAIMSDTRNEFNIVGMENLVGSEYYVSVWLFLPSSWSSPNPPGQSYNWYSICDTFMGTGSATPYPYYPYNELFIGQTAPNVFTLSSDIRDRMNGGQYEVPLGSYGDFPLPRGRWFNLRWYICRHVTNGIIRIWVDGIKVIDRTGTPASPIKTRNANVNDFFITVAKIYGSLGGPLPYRLWVDDLEIWNGMP